MHILDCSNVNGLVSNILFLMDNYPVSQGSCYSIKKILSGKGFRTEFINQQKKNSLIEKLYKKFIYKFINLPSQMQQFERLARENLHDKHFLEINVDEYIGIPPIYKPEKTRWDDAWTNEIYPTSKPLLGNISEEEILLSKDFYKNESKQYTWICYANCF